MPLSFHNNLGYSIWQSIVPQLHSSCVTNEDVKMLHYKQFLSARLFRNITECKWRNLHYIFILLWHRAVGIRPILHGWKCRGIRVHPESFYENKPKLFDDKMESLELSAKTEVSKDFCCQWDSNHVDSESQPSHGCDMCRGVTGRECHVLLRELALICFLG